MPNPSLRIVIDTNILIHFKILKQIKFPAFKVLSFDAFLAILIDK